MSFEAELDIRWPIGLLFLALGAVVALYGALSDQFRRPDGGLAWNLNLVWGLVMLAFGALMVWGARRAGRRQPRQEEQKQAHRA